MSKLTKEEMKAISDPHGFSGHCSPDGTPLTNHEYWEEQNKWN